MKNKGLLWMILAIVVVFLAGAVSGVFLDRHVLNRRHEPDRRGGPPFPSLEMLSRDLSLTVEQQDKIKNIFRDNEQRFTELRTSMHEQLEQFREHIKNEIEGVLTPEQLQKFRDILQKHIAERRKENDARRKNTQDPPQKENKGQNP
jgi:Spy/CpxP family protein refolding chaperone